MGGAEAVKQAQQHLEQERARWAEVSRVSEALHQERIDNHFVDRIRTIFQGG
jgi:predicted protein tyrosine phosphatase